MNTQLQALKHSELINRLVLNRQTAEEVGRVNDVWLDCNSHKVVGFTCKSGILGSKKRSFFWSEIVSIGADSIVVNLNPETNDPAKPEPVSSLINHEIWTDTGNKVGKLVDYLFNPQSGAVINYLFVSSGWRGILDGVYILPIAAIASIGRKRVMVSDAAVASPEQYIQGMAQKVGKAAEFIREDLEKTKLDFNSIKRGTQEITAGVKDKAQAATEKAKEISEQVKDKAQAATEKAKEISEQVKDKAQAATKEIGEQVKDKAQAATEKAKERLSEIKAKRQENALDTDGDDFIEIEAEDLPIETEEKRSDLGF